jgi:Ca2+-binding RTX toxin-like protein
MSGTNQARRTRNNRHRWWRVFHRTAVFSAMLFLVAEVAVVAVSSVRPSRAKAATAPTGQGFTVTPGDLAFILKQINIAERHAHTLATTPGNTDPCVGLVASPGDDIPNDEQVPDRLTSYGLRTVDGSCNNLVQGREHFAASDQTFPRLAKPPVFREAEPVPPGFPATPGTPTTGNTTYASKKGDVYDSQPRVISNLIVDQTSENPAAIEAALHPVRSQDPNGGVTLCSVPPTASDPADCVPQHKTLFIPNVTTDVGLSPPFNSVFTFFGQFFDHGVDQTVKSGSTVFVPLQPDDPLITLGPNGIPGDGDEVPAGQRFMVLTRAQNQPGPDGILGDRASTPDVDESADDVQDATNTDTPLVDQSQTYTSHASHQAFLREYTMVNNRPVNTGKLLGDPVRAAGPDGILGDNPDTPVDESADDLKDSGMSTWASVKKQAADKLGLQLQDKDATNIPLLAVDPYGNIIPGPDRGLAQYVTKTGLVEGVLDDPATTDVNEATPVPDNAVYFDTPFLTDISHNADPSPRRDAQGVRFTPTPDDDRVVNDPTRPLADPRTFDNELLDTHFTAGDGRVNENIALTAVHQIFHSEHDRLVDYIKGVLESDTSTGGLAVLAQWQRTTGPNGWNYGDRLFQAARFITEMEYQHLVFEEFARKLVPAIRPFHLYHSDLNSVIPAEFAHAVYRFGHSMLDDDVARTNADGSKNNLKLLTAFLNPPEFFNGGAAGTLTPEEAAGSIFMGSSDQTGNEIDEFVTETLRNNLLGLPLDLPTINMTRAREAGVPPLNVLRKEIFADTQDGQLTPYKSWSDYGQHLKHPESLINFVAAYGRHPSILAADGYLAKRNAARAIVNPATGDVPPTDAADFMFGTGDWASTPNGESSTTKVGLDSVDLWVGGLAEETQLFGGLLGSTFNYVFQNTLENLQDGDRFYYLARTPGMNLRTQLEGNSFSELIERNTQNTTALKSDAFATADCKFILANLHTPNTNTVPLPPDLFPPILGPGSVADDAASDCDENQLLQARPEPDGNPTIAYRSRNKVDPVGINGQAVYQGADLVVDKVFGGNDNDTLWGAGGSDVFDGGGGDDTVLGGDGNDRIADFAGADTLKGGPDNDAIDAGPGDDLVISGDGSDFTNGGANDNETFGGPDNDFIMAGQGADAVFGDGGDDWIEGGSGQDLLQGDHGAPFFDDPGEVKPGNDVFVGQVGENDYDTEGGDDLMSQNSAVDRNAGAGGFDWAFHQYDTVSADDDMAINNNLDFLGLPGVVNRDRWQETEADSGSKFNDVIKGVDDRPDAIGGAGFTGCDVLDQDGLDRITGLEALLPRTPGATSPLDGSLAAVQALTPVSCPLSGPIWGEGDILLGGGGSDDITGRGADDVIDGNKSLHVEISVRNHDNTAIEVGHTDLMEGQYLRDAAGNLTGPTLQAAVNNGDVDPGDLRVRREIVDAPATDAGVDTAVFLGPRSSYTITSGTGGAITVEQTGPLGAAVGTIPAQKVSDGIDTLTNIEQLKFQDQTVVLGPPSAPSGVSATAASTQATVSWTAATSDGGSSITSQEIVVSSGGSVVKTVTGLSATATTSVVTGLTNGTPYTFQVRAVNAFGSGPLSAASAAVTPGGPLTAPTNAVAVRGATGGSVSLSWNAATGGTKPITGYQIQVRITVLGITVVLRTDTVAGTGTTRNITGLTNGVTYTFRVRAVTAATLTGTIPTADQGPLSAASNAVTPATVPNAPGILAPAQGAVGGALTATANWTAPGNTGGSAITGYKIAALRMAADGVTPTGVRVDATAAANARTVSVALPAGGRYRFEVRATNAVGDSAPSTRSALVTAR